MIKSNETPLSSGQLKNGRSQSFGGETRPSRKMLGLAWLLLPLLAFPVFATQTIVFWQSNFPVADSAPISEATLRATIPGATLVDVNGLASALNGAEVLVMPYGSAFPEEAWPQIRQFTHQGGALVVLGGKPFEIAVSPNGTARRAPEYERELGILHTYAAPDVGGQRFAWRAGYEFLGQVQLRSNQIFVLEGRGMDGLGYWLDAAGDQVAAPVVAGRYGTRGVYLDFVPDTGFWDSEAGRRLIQAAVQIAAEKPHGFTTEMEFSTVKAGETPLLSVHLNDAPANCRVTLRAIDGAGRQVWSQDTTCSGERVRSEFLLPNEWRPGLYRVTARLFAGDRELEYYENGFWVEDESLLRSGPVLSSKGDFLTRDGKPFFPFGSNYFTTESNGWDFASSRNAAVWDRDFGEMQRHGMTFVRTGVWSGQALFTERPGGVNERFLRNVEAYLLSARRHNIAVNFNFFGFEPQGTLTRGQTPIVLLPGTNPYLDETTVRAEQSYVLSIVDRFRDVPWLSWDLINEPSFSNPARVFRGNQPNNDPAELSAWRTWLREGYQSIEKLAAAWSVTPTSLGSFDSVPLPVTGLTADVENGHEEMARAFDYNLFAQDMFRKWVHEMSQVIRGTGSRQLIDVGQDEGGVENRVLNQFYGPELSFTTNHTYRANEDLLWDSIAAKVPGVPNIVGETGYQPITYPNGSWRFDELTGYGLIERKWAAGFAAGTSGALSWDWDREIHFGLLRSDGSEKTWVAMADKMGAFVKRAEQEASGWKQPEVALVLPQSLQLSVFNQMPIEAQQNAIRALYGVAHSEAYAVGEYQLDRLGHAKLIIVPSPWVFDEVAWQKLMDAVEAGAVLLVSGRFDLDPHFNPTQRAEQSGVPYSAGLLDVVENSFEWPGGHAVLQYLGKNPDLLQQAKLANGATFAEVTRGKGKILFATLPLEMNTNWRAVGEVYSYALKQAGVDPVYSTEVDDPGLIICPAVFAHATLYFLDSETTKQRVAFRDGRSGRQFDGTLGAGRAALLLVGEKGDLLASYNW